MPAAQNVLDAPTENPSVSARAAGLVKVENASPVRQILAPPTPAERGLTSTLRKVSAEIPARWPPSSGNN